MDGCVPIMQLDLMSFCNSSVWLATFIDRFEHSPSSPPIKSRILPDFRVLIWETSVSKLCYDIGQVPKPSTSDRENHATGTCWPNQGAQCLSPKSASGTTFVACSEATWAEMTGQTASKRLFRYADVVFRCTSVICSSCTTLAPLIRGFVLVHFVSCARLSVANAGWLGLGGQHALAKRSVNDLTFFFWFGKE